MSYSTMNDKDLHEELDRLFAEIEMISQIMDDPSHLLIYDQHEAIEAEIKRRMNEYEGEILSRNCDV